MYVSKPNLDMARSHHRCVGQVHFSCRISGLAVFPINTSEILVLVTTFSSKNRPRGSSQSMVLKGKETTFGIGFCSTCVRIFRWYFLGIDVVDLCRNIDTIGQAMITCLMRGRLKKRKKQSGLLVQVFNDTDHYNGIDRDTYSQVLFNMLGTLVDMNDSYSWSRLTIIYKRTY
jgi:hypothetical protein